MRAAAIGILLVTMVGAVPLARAADEGAPAASAPAPEPQPATPTAPPDNPPPSLVRPPKQFPKLRQASLLHKYQLGIGMMPGVGYRGIFPYAAANDQMINCGQQGKRVCTGMVPFFLDVQPSFGFAEHWDVLVDLRYGIGTDFTTSHQFAVAPGVRYWVDPDQSVKFYATIQGVFDATAQHNALVKNTDFGIRNSNGFMFEVMRNLGFYIQFGETLGFVRWLRFEIDGGVGVQARIP
ncbi:MAG TPA: hypothetical protein VNR90_15080 [Vicinamibacterales bacterium]|jgi:hypothetical protein|nr:hypothetical protein [Vicinamibacterales bacterium]